MLIGIERAGVDIDVGVKLLNGDSITPCLQQFAYACSDDALA